MSVCVCACVFFCSWTAQSWTMIVTQALCVTMKTVGFFALDLVVSCFLPSYCSFPLWVSIQDFFCFDIVLAHYSGLDSFPVSIIERWDIYCSRWINLKSLLLWRLNACVCVYFCSSADDRVFPQSWNWSQLFVCVCAHVNVIIAVLQTRGQLVALLSITLRLRCFQLACGCRSSLK